MGDRTVALHGDRVRGSLSCGKEESRVKQHQLQRILIARPLAFNRVGRAFGNGHVGLENWNWMRVQLDLLSEAPQLPSPLFFPGHEKKGKWGSGCRGSV